MTIVYFEFAERLIKIKFFSFVASVWICAGLLQAYFSERKFRFLTTLEYPRANRGYPLTTSEV